VLGYGATSEGSKPGQPLLSPLAFECGACSEATDFLDTDIHGYHSELSRLDSGVGSVKVRGIGERVLFRCPTCAGTVLVVTAIFFYWDAVFDLLEEGTQLNIEDYFNEFQALAHCVSCGTTGHVCDLGKL
jgi:hypothetical protein